MDATQIGHTPLVAVAPQPAPSDRAPATRHALAEALLARGLLTTEGAERVQRAASTSGIAFSAAATRLGLVAEKDMAAAFADLLGIGLVERSALPPRPLAPAGLNPHFLKGHRVVPINEADDTVSLAMADPLDEVAAAGVGFATGKRVVRLAALESDIEDYFHTHGVAGAERGDSPAEVAPGPLVPGGTDDLERLSDRASDAPVIRLVDRLLTAAMDAGASDVHIEPSADAVKVRYRVDGLLQDVEVLSARWAEPIASRVKLLARLDIAEKRTPQDGRIRFSARGHSLDLRVATFPTLHGEAIVLRLLGQQTVALALDALDLGSRGLADLRQALHSPHGIVLITGPTGSGKTTTLYAALNAIRRPELKIVTVEDPVEYTLEGVSQLQVKPEIGLTYGAALRSVLRNDPDVIMIGEIRDRETADIAVRAALTGHLVLATLHTNTAAGAVTRLLDLGVEDYLLASTLVLCAAQRLVRQLCPACARMTNTTEEERILMAGALDPRHVPGTLARAVGCPACRERGYAGRLPIFEALPIGPEERGLIRGFSSEAALAECARRKGAPSLWQHGMEQVRSAKTTLDELMSVIEERSA